jgi:hypothetical protein
MAAVVASLGSGPRPVARDRARIERQIRELALEHSAGRLEDAIYLERLHELRDAKENLDRTSADDATSPERAVAWLRALSAAWKAAEVPAEKADLLHAIYIGSSSQGGGSCPSGSPHRHTPTDSRSRCPKRLQWRARQVLGAR